MKNELATKQKKICFTETNLAVANGLCSEVVFSNLGMHNIGKLEHCRSRPKQDTVPEYTLPVRVGKCRETLDREGRDQPKDLDSL
jgi:hypothetical protein